MYCSEECQNVDWVDGGHSKVCAELKQQREEAQQTRPVATACAYCGKAGATLKCGRCKAVHYCGRVPGHVLEDGGRARGVLREVMILDTARSITIYIPVVAEREWEGGKVYEMRRRIGKIWEQLLKHTHAVVLVLKKRTKQREKGPSPHSTIKHPMFALSLSFLPVY